MLFHPLIHTSIRYFSQLKRVCRTQELTSTERHILSLHSHLWVQLSTASAFPQPVKKDKFLRFFNLIIREYGSTLYVGLARAVPPTNTNFQPLHLLIQALCHTSTERHISSLYSHLWVQLSVGSAFPQPVKKDKFLLFFHIIIRECGSTLYVGVARTAPPTNTNFRLTFLLTRLQEALYEDLAV